MTKVISEAKELQGFLATPGLEVMNPVFAIIIVVSARVSRRVLYALRAAVGSGRPDGVPDDGGPAHPLRGQHDSHNIGASFTKNYKWYKMYKSRRCLVYEGI